MSASRSALTELLRKKSKAPAEWGEKYTLWVHDDYMSTRELVLNPELFPDVSVGDCIALVNPSDGSRICQLVSSMERGPFKQRSFQVSLHADVAAKFGLQSRQEVHVRRLAPAEIPTIAHVFIVFRDQYIGRITMMQIRELLKDTAAYVGKQIELPNACVRARIHSLYDQNSQSIRSGVFGTPFVASFRSETAKISILLQIAEETLHPASDAGASPILLERMIDGFLAELFDRWKRENVNHLVSIVLFCRASGADGVGKDYYSVAVEWASHTDWQCTLPRIRKSAQDMLAMIDKGGKRLAPSGRGNFLEAVHFALTIFDKHFVDRDLSKTGMSIIAVSPGRGHFIIDDRTRHDLCRLAKRKVIDDGIWLQLICLASPPPHVTPLLEICLEEGKEDGSDYYHPYWIRCGYYHPSSMEEGSSVTMAGASQHPPNSDALSSTSTSNCSDADLIHAFDPANPSAQPPKYCLICSSKWSLLDTAMPNRFIHSPPDWPTLVAPPCLPIRIVVRLNQEYLNVNFATLADYVVTSATQESFFLQRDFDNEMLLQELINLRMALGLQILHKADLPRGVCAMLIHHEIHLLASEGRGVRVRILLKSQRSRSRGIISSSGKEEEEPIKPVPYTAFIEPLFADEYVERRIEIDPLTLSDYPWERVDNMIAGNDSREIPEGRYWQSRFILIPADEAPRNSLIMATAANEILDDEELRIAGFLKFVEVFQRCALTRPSPTSAGDYTFRARRESLMEESPLETLKIQLTTLNTSGYARQEDSKVEESQGPSRPASPTGPSPSHGRLDSILDVEPLERSSDVRHVAVLMQHPLVGLNIKNRRWHLFLYRSVFVGSAAVDWILKFFEDIHSREEAVEYGNELLDRGVWEHIFGTHRFLDGYYYYRFGPEFNLSALQRRDPHILSSLGCSRGSRETTWDEGGREDSRETSPSPTRAVIMSRSVVLDVDYQRRSPGRREWAILHYDATHNPRNAFHFRLHWLTCSSRLVDDLIQSWARRASQCGFVMLEAPVESSFTFPRTPFGSAIRISFSVPPPSVSQVCSGYRRADPELHISESFFAEELLLHFAFVLDSEADTMLPETSNDPHGCQILWSYERPRHEYTQYIHKSGVAIVHITPHGLLWTANRLLLASTASRAVRPSQQNQFFPVEADIRRQVVEYCNDSTALSAFWARATRKLKQITQASESEESDATTGDEEEEEEEEEEASPR